MATDVIAEVTKEEMAAPCAHKQCSVLAINGGSSSIRFALYEEGEPDVVMACRGDVPTLETLAAVDLLWRYFPKLKVRVINVVDLMKLQPQSEHKPITFAHHGYPTQSGGASGQIHRRNGGKMSHVVASLFN